MLHARRFCTRSSSRSSASSIGVIAFVALPTNGLLLSKGKNSNGKNCRSMLLPIVAGLMCCFGSIHELHGQQSNAEQSFNFGKFQQVSSPLPKAKKLRFQEQPALLSPESAAPKSAKQSAAQEAEQKALGETAATELGNTRPDSDRSSAMAEIDQRLTLIEQFSKQAPVASEEIKSLIDGAKLQLVKAREAIVSTAAFDEQTRSAPAKIRALQQKLTKDDFEVEITFDEETPVTELPQINQLESYLASIKQALQETHSPIASLTAAELQQSITDIAAKASDTATKLAEVERQLQTDPLSDDQQFVQARKWNLEAERLKLNASIASDKAEIRSREASSQLPELQKAVAEKQAARLEQEIKLTEDAISRIHAYEIQNLKLQSHDTQKTVSQPLQTIAQSNTALTQQLSKIAAEIKTLKDDKDAIKKDALRIRREETTTKTRIKVVGLSDSFGQMLQRNRAGLTETQQRYLPINERNQQIADSEIAAFRWEDELAKFSSVPDAATAAVELLAPKDNASLQEKQQLESEVGELFNLRKDILARLKRLADEKTQELVLIKAEQKQLIAACESYESLIDENILWVRSAPIASLADVSVISGVAEDLAAPARWKTVLDAIVASFKNRMLTSMLLTLTVVALLIFREQIKATLNLSGEKAIKRSCRDFGVTVTTYILTLAMAFAVLAPLALVGWLLTNNPKSSLFAVSLGKACFSTFLIGLPFEILRQTCRENGLAHSHFAWTERTRKVLRNNLTWFVPVGLPLIALLTWLPLVGSDYHAVKSDANAMAVAWLESPQSTELPVAGANPNNSQLAALAPAYEFSGSNAWNRLGRVFLLVLLLVAQIFTFRTLHPNHGVLIDSSSTAFSQGTWQRIGYILFVGAIVIPLVLMLMAIVGYYFSSIQIGKSLLTTIALAIGVAIVYSGAMRFLLVRRRHLRYEQLVHQRNQARLALEKKGGADAVGSPAEVIDIDLQNDPGLDITDVSRQARELTNVIFLMISAVILLGIWQYLLPASKIMDDWRLWSISLDGKIEAVTIRDVLFSSLMFLVTYFGVRNIPGMLELILLQKLPLDAGARYAVTSIFRYILLVVGCIFALGYLKIPWSNYSWLVAAISVGLGFGLQEIVANFVSGLILLLERPVRVGDVVTIDGTTGVVSRIQMRATTVTNWDNQELVVPNKDLISGKLLNWTLSSVVNRIALKFGVAYGTDPEHVQKIVIDAVSSNRALLKEPPPVVTFEEFGDSSLNFTLRCCVSTIERRWIIVHDLNVAINQALATENISIPFPQRDVHLIPSEPNNQTDV